MSDIAAAALCDHFDGMIQDAWVDRYQDLINFAVTRMEEYDLQLAIPAKFPTVLSCLFVKLRTGMGGGETVVRRLSALGIEAKHYYTPLVSRSEAPDAWDLYDTTVCLPFHVGVSKTDLAKMFKLI